MYEMSLFHQWLENAVEDQDVIDELKSMVGNNDMIRECFFRDLEFGTGGLRGIIGAGTARLNIYTIRRTTQGLSNYLLSKTDKPTVAIAYDSRIKSELFAKEAAGVLAANGINAYIFKELMPTPVLSYAVRKLKTDAGIIITASHNPSKYNGYKVYGSDGCQLTLRAAEIVTNEIEEVDMFRDIKKIPFEQGLKSGLIKYIDDDVLESFIDTVLKQSINPDVFKNTDLKVVYTPLNGTGLKPVKAVMQRIGLKEMHIVAEQEKPDGNFPTVPYPNPEFEEAYEYSLKLAQKVNPDIILATDPDCDRVGVMVRHDDKFVKLNGNEIGCLMLNYCLSQRADKGTLDKNPIFIKSIVSTTLANEIAKKYGCSTIEVLTGFKFIGEQMTILEQNGESRRFVMAFEESYGYLVGDHVRDKDAVVGSLMLCEMAAFYKQKGKTLYNAMQEIYNEFGQYNNTIVDKVFEGSQGVAKIKGIMHDLRTDSPKEIAGFKVTEVSDYLNSVTRNLVSGETSKIILPRSNVLSFTLSNNSRIMIRPSGTEPKIKFYFNVIADSRDEAESLTQKLVSAMDEYMD